MELWEVEWINMCFLLLLNGVLVVGVVWASLGSSDICNKLEKKILKEYECCLQERKDEVPVHVTSWFPLLPSLSAASDLNLTVDQLILLFCNREIHDVACINQMLDRVLRANTCLPNDTVNYVQKQADVQEKRRYYLCDKRAIYALYYSGASECLKDKSEFLCMKYIMDGFDLDGDKYEPNCDEFHKLQNCLQDEWKELCGEEATIFLLKLMRMMYASYHCSDYEGEADPPPPAASGAQLVKINGLHILSIFHILQSVLLLS